MTFDLHIEDNGSTINLDVSRHERLLGQVIHDGLVAMLGSDAVAYSRVTKYLRQQHFPTISSEAPDEIPMIIVEDAIRAALDKQPFSPIPKLANRPASQLPRSIDLHQHGLGLL
jgi:hypothetical protein